MYYRFIFLKKLPDGIFVVADMSRKVIAVVLNNVRKMLFFRLGLLACVIARQQRVVKLRLQFV